MIILKNSTKNLATSHVVSFLELCGDLVLFGDPLTTNVWLL